MQVLRFALSAGAIVVAITLSATARAVVIDFDDLDASGGPVAVTNQYAMQGVTFDGLIVIAALPGQASSVPNAGVINDEPPFSLLVTANFSSAVDSVSAFFSDTEVGTQLVIMRAFDLGGMEIGVADVLTPGAESQIVGINAPGIRSVTLETDADGTLFDDFTFNTAIPEPASLSLLALGLAATATRRRRSHAA